MGIEIEKVTERLYSNNCPGLINGKLWSIKSSGFTVVVRVGCGRDAETKRKGYLSA